LTVKGRCSGRRSAIATFVCVGTDRPCVYIEPNTVRACMVAHPAEYRWSSYRANAQGTCGKCGSELGKIDEDISEQLDVESAKLMNCRSIRLFVSNR
jgi:hypothetical protein